MLINPFVFPPPSASFSPNDIASIWAYFEADSYVGVYNDGDTIVANWTDKSGNGRHAVKSGGSPKFKTNQLNGEPSVLLEVGGYFTIPTMVALSEASYYQVTRVAAVTAGGDRFSGIGGADHYPYTTTDIYNGWGSTTRRGPLTSLVTLSNYHLVHGWSKSNDWAIKQNNSLLSSSASNTVGFHPTSCLLGYNGSQFRNAHVPALYLFSAKLSPTDDANMLSYINAKFGV